MLKFNPERQLQLRTNHQQQLETILAIHNPTNMPAPFKVKSTRPSLFIVEPPIGNVLPFSQTNVTIKTRQTSTPSLAHDICYNNRFLVEYALVDKINGAPEHDVCLITDENKQEHKLFLVSGGSIDNKDRDDRSVVSGKLSYRTVHEEDQDLQFSRGPFDRSNYNGMSKEQKSQHLNIELQRLEKEKSELLMTSKPKGGRNLLKLVIILLMALIVGNLIGRGIGLGTRQQEEKRIVKEEKWYYFGLDSYWNKPEPKVAKKKEWWAFWK